MQAACGRKYIEFERRDSGEVIVPEGLDLCEGESLFDVAQLLAGGVRLLGERLLVWLHLLIIVTY